MNGLLTDLYELTMAAGYFEAGKTEEKATFEVTVRRLPPYRNYVLAAGLPQVVDYLLNLNFAAEEVDYLRHLPQFRSAPAAFFDYLLRFRFTGDLFAVYEGTPLFANEPMMTLRSPIIEAILENASSAIYGIIVTAFEYRSASTADPIIYWQTRIGLPANGKSMAEALPAMMLAAGPAIGRENESPVLINVDEPRKGHVELGELQSRGVVDELPPRSKDSDAKK